MTGSGMQQARDLRAEETVEVVRNHEGGGSAQQSTAPDVRKEICDMAEGTPPG
jgi:hypothetical protein